VKQQFRLARELIAVTACFQADFALSVVAHRWTCCRRSVAIASKAFSTLIVGVVGQPALPRTQQSSTRCGRYRYRIADLPRSRIMTFACWATARDQWWKS